MNFSSFPFPFLLFLYYPIKICSGKTNQSPSYRIADVPVLVYLGDWLHQRHSAADGLCLPSSHSPFDKLGFVLSQHSSRNCKCLSIVRKIKILAILHSQHNFRIFMRRLWEAELVINIFAARMGEKQNGGKTVL